MDAACCPAGWLPLHAVRHMLRCCCCSSSNSYTLHKAQRALPTVSSIPESSRRSRGSPSGYQAGHLLSAQVGPGTACESSCHSVGKPETCLRMAQKIIGWRHALPDQALSARVFMGSLALWNHSWSVQSTWLAR